MRRRLPIFTSMLALFALSFASSGQVVAPPDFDRWYSIFIRGQKAGHAHVLQATAEDGRVTSTMLMDFEMSRSRMTTTMEMVTTFVESADRELERVEFAQRLGLGTSVESAYVFEDDRIVKVSSHMGDESRSSQPRFDMEYMTPVEARAHLVQQIDAGAAEISVIAPDPTTGLKLAQTITRVQGPAKIDVYGRERVAMKVTSVSSAAPSVEVVEYLDEQGVALITEMKMGAFPFRLVATTKEEALREGEGGAPEMFTPTLVSVDPPVESPRETREASFVLRVKEGRLPELFTGGAQVFERIDEKTGRVTVDLSSPVAVPGTVFSETRFTKPTTYANTEDTQIIQLAHRAVRDAPENDVTARAEALRAFVYGFIESKNLGTAFATASEVCRTGEGDCSEHAVLLAAMLRAKRIPARVISGLVYADRFAGRESVFAFHMWTQALMTVDGEPRWIDLDATLDGVPMDAMHIAVSSYDLTDDEMVNSLTPVVSLLGNLEIEVESVERD